MWEFLICLNRMYKLNNIKIRTLFKKKKHTEIKTNNGKVKPMWEISTLLDDYLFQKYAQLQFRRLFYGFSSFSLFNLILRQWGSFLILKFFNGLLYLFDSVVEMWYFQNINVVLLRFHVDIMQCIHFYFSRYFHVYYSFSQIFTRFFNITISAIYFVSVVSIFVEYCMPQFFQFD